MKWRYAGLTIVLALIILVREIARLSAQSVTPQAEWFTPSPSINAESRLAMGLKLPILCADLVALELISGVSDRLASDLLTNRFKMRAALQGGGKPGLSEQQALELTHGVGPKTSAKLIQFISIAEPCPNDLR